MVDLDRDVVRARGGEANVEDEDQFAERGCATDPDSVVEAARQTCEGLMERVRREGDSGGDEPFASAYRYWLGLIG
ncbi:hypothetical protein [Streptomyces sp. NPDC054958]